MRSFYIPECVYPNSQWAGTKLKINKMIAVVLISVDEINARKICERVENTTIEDFDNDPNFKDIAPNNYEVYTLSNFMDMVNNQERDVLTKYFITFVNT